jgi:ferric-dicitrate binding protein FerR (iron transport regulator)
MNGTEHYKDHSRKDNLEELFRHASVRERPPLENEQAIRQALHAEWSGMTRHRKQRRVVVAWAAAASVFFAVIVGLNLVQSPESGGPAMQLATVEKLTGTVLVQPPREQATQSPAVSAALEAGQRILSAGNSRMAIRWLNGESIRLDENTELRLDSTGEIDLLAGRIYVDTAEAGPTAELAITTPAGLVRHLGTRYMTAVSADGTSVSVREGQVMLEAQGVESVADRGEQLKVTASGAHSLEMISTYGSLWQWTEELAPAFSSDGRSMADFLNWVARESGREVEFASPEAEKVANDTLLRGQVEMEPMRALTVVMQTSDLAPEISAGTIVVRLLARN